MEDSPFRQTLDAFSDSQRPRGIELLEKLQRISDFTLDFRNVQESIDSIQQMEFDNKDLYLVFITSYLSTAGAFPNLKHLKVHHLRNESIPLLECIEQFSALTELNLSNCKLSSEMQEDFKLWRLTDLCVLKLDNTQLKQLPPSVGRLRNLEHLSLSHNNLSQLPITLEFCQKLETLDLSHNKFKAIPGVILHLKQGLKSLRRLNNDLVQRWDGLETFPHIKVKKPQDRQDKDEPDSLQSQAARAIMTFHVNYWSIDSLPSLQCKLLDTYGSKYNYCFNCHDATDEVVIEVLLPVFADIRDVPFMLHSCNKCQASIKEDLTQRQTELKKWLEDDHATRMEEAMKREGISPKDTHLPPPRDTNRSNKCCLIM